MDKNLIDEIKKKKEFSKLPDSIVGKIADQTKDIKLARAFLRKYFGVFLTNKVLKGKGSAEEVLKAHISSKKRDYSTFYEKIFEGLNLRFNSVVDLGAGVNGYSYNFLRRVLGEVDYTAVEASGQVVNNANSFFRENTLTNCSALWLDLFNIEKVIELVKEKKKLLVIFMFQLIDALENMKKDFSKELILRIKECLSSKDLVVISLPVESLSGRKNFEVRRKWLVDFLREHFEILKDFVENGERVIVVRKA